MSDIAGDLPGPLKRREEACGHHPSQWWTIREMASWTGMAKSTLFRHLKGFDSSIMASWINLGRNRSYRLARLRWIIDHTQGSAGKGSLRGGGQAAHDSLNSSVNRSSLSQQVCNVSLERQFAQSPSSNVFDSGLIRLFKVCASKIEYGADFGNRQRCDDGDANTVERVWQALFHVRDAALCY